MTDANNCQADSTFDVMQPSSALSVNVVENNYLLTANTSGGTSPFSYSWRDGSNNQLSTSSSYTVTTYGSYYVIVTDVNGCVITSNTFSFTATWDCIDGVCIDPFDDSGAYSSLASCNAACVMPSWDCVGGVCIDPGTGNGQYGSFAICTSFCNNTAIEDLSSFNILIYPNPFRDETTIDFGTDVNEAIISVVDVYGKQIELYTVVNTDKHVLKRDGKARGVYFVEIEIEGLEQLIIKLVIE